MLLSELKKIILNIPPEYDGYDIEIFNKENEWMDDCKEIGVNTEREAVVIR